MGTFRFAYFNKFLDVTIPDANLVEKLQSAKAPALDDVYKETRSALTSPIGTVPLKNSVGENSSVLLAVPDKSRHTDVREILRAVLDELLEAGVKKDNITIIIALGTHRAMSGKEIAAKIGEKIATQFNVVNHDHNTPSALIDFGQTDDGVPAVFNKLIAENDFVISIGNISAHPVGGYSGGAKGLLPGLASPRTIFSLHWDAIQFPLFDIFGKADNPMRTRMEKVVGMAGLDFIVNTTENADREISGIFAGHYIDAHRAGVKFMQSSPLMAFPLEMSDVLIIGLGSDRPDFWGGAAGIYAAAALLNEGGTLVLFAECPEGVAPEHPVVLDYGYPHYKELIKHVESGKINDKTGASHVVTIGKIIVEKKIKVILVSRGISKAEAFKLGFGFCDDPQKAVDLAIAGASADARVLFYERI